ncbi:non-ribosomal peptide synthetase [Kushneria aurantia]|uniref:Non-ribosomal peptide synthetase n=1 Tax=Kushneria aurantia TaxID=504092 RepID=A0ABV6G4Z6_9GAMM|nr:non-ribosomal peptide synthetase [Kushneria aurantia]
MNSTASRALGGGQAGIWYGQQSSREQGGYATAQCLEIRGAIDPRQLARATALALEETQSSFERFVEDERGPRRLVAPATRRAPDVAVIDLRDDPEPRKRAFREMAQRREQPFELERGPLARQALWWVADDHLLWWLNMHHIAADAWAFALIQQRAAEHYAALVKGTQARTAWYGGIDRVVEEEQRYLDDSAFETDRRYWHQRLSDAPEPVSPAGRFAPASAYAHRRELGVGAEATWRFRQCCDGRRIGLAEAIMAAAGSWYARMSGRADITLGIPMMGRLQGAALKTPMTQVNLLPLRLASGFEATPANWCGEAAEALGGMRRHQRYRHEWLLRDLGRRPGRRPLQGMQVNVLPFDPAGQWPGCRVAKHHLVAGPVEELVFSVYLGGDSDAMRLALDANPALFSGADTERHLERLRHWLLEFVASLDTPLAKLELTSEADRRALAAFNATDHAVETTHMATLFERRVAATPHHVALRADGETLDYAALGARVEALATHLRRAGVLPGEAVGVLLPRSLDMQVALLAIHHVGAAWLPLPLAYPDARLAEMVERATPRLVLTHNAESARLSGAPAIQLDAPPLAAELATAGAPLKPLASDDPRRAPALAAYILFTSGSTGRPKGVVVEQHAIVNRLLWMQGAYALDVGDRVLQKTPNGFDVSVWEFLWPMIGGASLVMAQEAGHRDPRYLIDTVIAEAVTTLHFVPSMLALWLAELSAADTARMTALRQVFVSGEALTGELVRRFFARLPSVELHNLYGPTEAAVDVSAHRCTPQDGALAGVPIGAPIWNTRLHVLDERLQPLPPGVSGELYIAGRNLSRGYLGQPELTAERFVEQPALAPYSRLYRSGDLARWRADGELEYLGRLDHQVKLRGQRLELGEIEAALLCCDAIAQVAVDVQGSAGEARLVAWVVAAAGFEVEPETLKRELAARLPDYMVPGVFVPLTALPLSANGKLDRKALPAPPQQAVGAGLPATPRQQQIAELFAEVLGLARVGVEDNFFDLGGHSLSAVELVRRLNQTLGSALTVAALFEAPTVMALDALEGDGAGRHGLGVLLPLREAGSQAPLFCIHPAGGLAWCYAGLARALPADYPLYGLQARGLHAGETRPASMDEMARDYIEQARRVNSSGRWRLLGWSVGGMIAHTMAAILEAEGEEVELLALLDAYPADLWRDMTPPDERMALTALLRIAGVELDNETEGEGELNRAAVIALLRREGSALGQLDAAILEALVDVVINNSRLVRDTRHQRFGGDMHFFTAAAPRAEVWLDREAWRPFLGGELINRDLDATHPQLMHPRRLQAIADDLVAALRRRYAGAAG